MSQQCELQKSESAKSQNESAKRERERKINAIDLSTRDVNVTTQWSAKKEKEIRTRHQKRKVSKKRYNTIARKGNLYDRTPFTFKCNKINVHTKLFVYVVTNPLFGRWLVAIPQSSNPGIGFHPLHPPHFTLVHEMDFTNIFKNQVPVFISQFVSLQLNSN